MAIVKGRLDLPFNFVLTVYFALAASSFFTFKFMSIISHIFPVTLQLPTAHSVSGLDDRSVVAFGHPIYSVSYALAIVLPEGGPT